jgi:hypothetical protein
MRPAGAETTDGVNAAMVAIHRSQTSGSAWPRGIIASDHWGLGVWVTPCNQRIEVSLKGRCGAWGLGNTPCSLREIRGGGEASPHSVIAEWS